MQIDKTLKYCYKYVEQLYNMHTYSSILQKRGFFMSGKTSSAAKNRYNAKAYDQIPLRVKKGQKEIIQKRAEQLNKSVNGYITDLIEEDLAGSNLLEE